MSSPLPNRPKANKPATATAQKRESCRVTRSTSHRRAAESKSSMPIATPEKPVDFPQKFEELPAQISDVPILSDAESEETANLDVEQYSEEGAMAMLPTDPLSKNPSRARNTKRSSVKSDGSNRREIAIMKFKNYSVKEFIEKIGSTLQYFYFNDAEYLCLAALEKYPNNYDLLKVCAKAFIEVGHESRAIECFSKCIYIMPNHDYTNYMLLASLLSDSEKAVENYSIACDLINLTGQDKEHYTKDLIKCYCDMAILHLNKLIEKGGNDQTSAELCMKCAESAIDTDEQHPLAYQILAKLKIQVHKLSEAKALMQASIERWMPAYLTFSEFVEDLSLPDEYPPEMKILDYEQRLVAVDNLLNLGNFDLAEEVLAVLEVEDDQVMELQYFYGLLNYKKGNRHHACAKYRLEYSLIINDITRTDDDRIVPHINELLAELAEVPNAFDDDNDDAGGDNAADIIVKEKEPDIESDISSSEEETSKYLESEEPSTCEDASASPQKR